MIQSAGYSGDKHIYVPRMCEVRDVTSLTKWEKLLDIKIPKGEELSHSPGQFVELSILGVGEAPISVCSSPTKKGSFELTIRKAGAVTSASHELQIGDSVGIRGPFGRGFDVERLKGHNILAIAGGIGLAPLRSMINYIIDSSQDFGALTILYGCRQPTEILQYVDLERWKKLGNVDFRMTVDQGDDNWKGNVGLITTLIPPLKIDPLRTYALIVGPPIMYRFVIQELLIKKNLPEEHIVLSLERMMKCGVGKCGHCAIADKYCCTDGPVFFYPEIKHYEGAL
jgi:sulfhydrogenase subunit gamma (sulfur reductase)